MKLEKYISDLLYRYDLVIVPEFGGIIGRKNSARIDTDSYIFSPPHKELSFNINLKNNDGLLVNYISDLQQVSHETAYDFIKKEIAEWREILKKNKRIKLEQIGIFNLLNDDRLVFMPLTTKNYLIDAYGLSSFIRKPKKSVVETKQKPFVKAEKTIAKPVKKDIVATPTRKKVVVGSKRTYRKQNKNNNWKYAAVFVLGLGLFGGIASYYNSKSEPEVQVYQKATFTLPNNFPVVNIGNKAVETNNAISTNEVVKNEIPNKYFIISGAFRNKENADKKVSELSNLGYKASIIGQNKRNLYMVAYSGFPTFEEANKEMIPIKKEHKEIWIYKKMN
jgi:cell division protein FtsN